MNWFEYLKKTSLKQICVDWKEFQKLRRKYAKTLEQRNYRSKKMQLYPCINIIPTGHQYAFFTNYQTKYCSKFFGKKCNETCTCHKIHDEYWKFYDDAKSLRMQIAEFWGKKFQNVK